MTRFRIRKRTIWRTHSILGLVAGIGLVVIGITGSILMFSKEIDGALRPEIVRVQPAADGQRLPMDTLVATAATAFPQYRLMGWLPAESAGESDRVWMTRPDDGGHWLSAYLDPYSAEVLSAPEDSAASFTGWILELHYMFLAGHVGIAISGIFGVLLLLLGISGLWLYRDFYRNFFRLRWGRSMRILLSDVHKFVGINTVAFNLVLGFTGAWWNLAHVIGHLREEAPTEKVVKAPVVMSPSDWGSLDSILRDAPNRIAGFQANYIAFPQIPEKIFYLYGEHGGAGSLRSPYGSMMSYDAAGGFRESADIRDASLWAQIYDAFVPLHYGTFGGWPIRVLWCLGGLAPGTLAVSGFLIWNSRRRNKSKAITVSQPKHDSIPTRSQGGYDPEFSKRITFAAGRENDPRI